MMIIVKIVEAVILLISIVTFETYPYKLDRIDTKVIRLLRTLSLVIDYFF
jgi:hypothetical protein